MKEICNPIKRAGPAKKFAALQLKVSEFTFYPVTLDNVNELCLFIWSIAYLKGIHSTTQGGQKLGKGEYMFNLMKKKVS